MIFQGIFKIFEIYSNEINLFHNNLKVYFRKKILTYSFFSESPKKESLNETLQKVIKVVIEGLKEIGFDNEKLECDLLLYFSDVVSYINFEMNSIEEIYEKVIFQSIYEYFLEKIYRYLVDLETGDFLLKLKLKGLMPVVVLMELMHLKKSFNENQEKLGNLCKYLQIKDFFIKKFCENKQEIEKLELLTNAQNKLQLMYFLYRMICFFNISHIFDFSPIIQYLEKNEDEYLESIPLVTLKNPDLHYCGIFLAKHLKANLKKEEVINFLNSLYNEIIEDFESPIIEATRKVYFLLKSLDLMQLKLEEYQAKELLSINPKYFNFDYLKQLETSRLIIILKISTILQPIQIDSRISDWIIEEIEQRIMSIGIKDMTKDTFSSETMYYIIFYCYVRGLLDKLCEYNFLPMLIAKIYRNLEVINFSKDMNYDLLTELLYSLECLKLINCMDSIHITRILAKYFFPQEIVEKFLNSKKIESLALINRHFKINKITGEIYFK